MINIVLFEPEIPQNTGNIMRSAVGTNVKLHLIKPLGFSLDDKYLKRSALDYLTYLEYSLYENFSDFEKQNKGQYFFITRYGNKVYSALDFTSLKEDIYLIFGKESTGIDRTILANNLDRCYRIPISSNIRSLNLANAVAIVLFEVLRQKGFEGLSLEEPDSLKGKNYLKQFINKKGE